MKINRLKSGKEKEKKRSTSKDLLKIVRDWAEVSTAHGIPNYVRTDIVLLRVFWTLAFLLSCGYCFFLIITMVLSYFTYGVNTSSQLVIESPTNFPAVDICNLTPFSTVSAQILIQNILDNKNLSNVDKKLAKQVTDKNMYEVMTQFQYKSSKGEVNLTSYSSSIEDMLVSCKFKGKNCSASDFFRFQSFYYGNCYRFNGGSNSSGNTVPVLKATKSGPRYGLELEIDVGEPESAQYLSYRAGIRVIVHNQSDTAIFPEEDGINVATGFYTDIAVTRTFSTKMAAPFSDCLDSLNEQNTKSNDYFGLIYKRFGKDGYSQKYCVKVCLQKYFNDNCFCTDFSLPYYIDNVKNATFCINETQLSCLERMEQKFFDGSAIDNCQSNCPIECSRNLIDMSVSTANYPSKWFIKDLILGDNETAYDETSSDFGKRYLVMNVFYADLSFTIISESPAMTDLALIGNLGGTLGLFIGISFLSVAENLELLFLIIHYFATRDSKVDAN